MIRRFQGRFQCSDLCVLCASVAEKRDLRVLCVSVAKFLCGSVAYSERSAIVGSTRDTRRAGT